MGAITEPAPAETGGQQRAPARRWRVDPLLALCAVALVALPLLCALAASRLPVEPPRETVWPAAPAGPPVRDVPVLEPPARGPLLDHPGTVRALVAGSLRDLFPGPAARRLSRFLNGPGLGAPSGVAW